MKDADHPLLPPNPEEPLNQKIKVINDERRKISTIVRDASTEALCEHVRLRSFRNIVVATAVFMTLLALGIAIAGMVKPTLIPIRLEPRRNRTAR